MIKRRAGGAGAGRHHLQHLNQTIVRLGEQCEYIAATLSVPQVLTFSWYRSAGSVSTHCSSHIVTNGLKTHRVDFPVERQIKRLPARKKVKVFRSYIAN